MENSMNIYEQAQAQIRRTLLERYAPRLDLIASEKPKYDDPEERFRLAMLFENINAELLKRQSILETTQTANVTQGIKNQYFDIVTAVFPNLIAQEVFSVQPLQSRSGVIFWMNYVRGSQKGNIAQGSTVYAPNQRGMEYKDSDYTSDAVNEEELFTGDGSEKTFTGNLSYTPLSRGTITIVAGSATITDNGEGILSGGSGISGTIDYSSGAYSITFTTAPAVDVLGLSTYRYENTYAPTMAPQLDLTITQTPITTTSRKLIGRFSLDAAYDLKMAQGIDASSTMMQAASHVLQQEIDGELLAQAYNSASNSTSWNDKYYVDGRLSKLDFYQGFVDNIYQASSAITQATLRVEGNFIIVGKRANDILHMVGAPRFVASGTSGVGPHFVGTLDNKWKVYFNPYYDVDAYLVGYKGSNNLIDAGLIYAPYLPFYSTDVIMLDDFMSRQGFATTYGKKMVNANMYVKGTITHT